MANTIKNSFQFVQPMAPILPFTDGFISEIHFTRDNPKANLLTVLKAQRVLHDPVLGNVNAGIPVNVVIVDTDALSNSINPIDTGVASGLVVQYMGGLQVVENRMNAAILFVQVALANMAQEMQNAGAMK